MMEDNALQSIGIAIYKNGNIVALQLTGFQNSSYLGCSLVPSSVNFLFVPLSIQNKNNKVSF